MDGCNGAKRGRDEVEKGEESPAGTEGEQVEEAPSCKKTKAEGERLRGEEGAALELAGLEPYVGQRVEVLWDVENCGKKTMWWGASVGLFAGDSEYPAARTTDGSGQVIFSLEYDEKDGNPPTSTRVVFVDALHLLDLDYSAELSWKKEGASEELHREAIKSCLADESSLTIGEVHEALQEGGADEELERQGEEELQAMPYAQQLALRTGFRQFANTVKSKLMEVARGGTEITEGDIKSIMEHVKQQRAV